MTMNSGTRYLLRSGPGNYAFNMALDEALLEAMPRLAVPLLRFYGWTEPAASFGYFQKYTDVERLTSLRPLVRRPTGGGVVPHEADWTYSLAFPTTDDWYSLKATASYRRVHEWIRAAFVRVGITTELARISSKATPGQCFKGHEQSDVLCEGRKVAGAAQRRTRDGLLIQGSVQPPTARLARSDWERAMCEVVRAEHGSQWVEFVLDAALAKRANELARQKYSQPDYNRKR